MVFFIYPSNEGALFVICELYVLNFKDIVFIYVPNKRGDRGSTVVKVLCYKLEGRWFDPSWCHWIFHYHKIPPIALWP